MRLPGLSIAIVRESVRDLLKMKFPVESNNKPYIEAGIDWICRGQDKFEDGGVPCVFCLKNGWGATYPEVTGYIIPTMFAYHEIYSKNEIAKRAIHMANWLLDIQLPGGGFQAGTTGATRIEPTIFNTGQILFGLVKAYESSSDNRYLRGITRATDWLISMQDEDGAWRKGGSAFTSYNVNTYNTRTAWALLNAGQVTDNDKYLQACCKNIEWALNQQISNGWYGLNCLDDRSIPLLHTIAYATRGILEVGLSLNKDRFIMAARKTADALLALQRSNGCLSGRYDMNWSPTANWICLTGDAQIDVIWLKLFQLTNESKYLIAARRNLHFLKSTVNLKSKNNGIKGGLKGAYPIWSPYGEYQYLSWGTKFFIDALLLDLKCASE